jgi:hypothetical protein
MRSAGFLGFRKHVIPMLDSAVAWDLCFLKPLLRLFLWPLPIDFFAF